MVSDLRYGWKKLRKLSTDVSDNLTRLQVSARLPRSVALLMAGGAGLVAKMRWAQVSTKRPSCTVDCSGEGCQGLCLSKKTSAQRGFRTTGALCSCYLHEHHLIPNPNEHEHERASLSI